MSAGVPVFPLYQRPVPLIYKSGILGHEEQPRHRRAVLEHRGLEVEVVGPQKAG